jgi:glucokinase
MRIIAADIGGTYSRVAWQDDDTSADERLVVENADFETFDAVLRHAYSRFGIDGRPIDCMALALPGPVHQEPVVLTNIPWQVSRAAIARDFNVGRLVIANDFQAAAMGAVGEPREALKVLNPGEPDDGPVVVTGAGTGLGMSWFAGDPRRYWPRATEGGHQDFAPQDTRQAALHARLAERLGHVSYERVLSGDGLLNCYRGCAGVDATAATPAEVLTLARSGAQDATDAIDLFTAVFAAYAGNLALAFNPTGGIYLCGGLTLHMADWFDEARFRARYVDKGRMADVVTRIPVFLVTRHNTGLAGAIRLARHNPGADS